MLLLGLFLSSAIGIAFVPKPNWLTCTFIRAGVGISYAIVYAALLVKTVFLLSLHTGVYLSAEYQALLMFFIIATQLAIDSQWIIHTRSTIIVDYWDGFGQAVYRCDHTPHQFIWSLSYVMVLIEKSKTSKKSQQQKKQSNNNNNNNNNKNNNKNRLSKSYQNIVPIIGPPLSISDVRFRTKSLQSIS
ncbi:class C metabotropic glutamate-like protein G-protein coupled receptor-like protein [Sarcoptes scabiei]|uniref:Class C metabotropic glutamate-like protein G-protein coupled receptor-like protein n=1 Tax=Sarcoptes scabiei TaxID=52283 RepID=A0A132A652_SARSC|nr:class C metabotropic glutamate-like protein G-protein coupled receptor-like protein [Sarcoptes scabiei]